MAASSFNCDMLNFWIGMLQKHPVLKEGSASVQALGYRLFQIEPSFVGGQGTVNPDAVAISEQQGHTLLAEWTSAEQVSERKRTQIEKYSRVSGNDLANVLAVPVAAAKTSGVLLVVRPQAMAAFEPLTHTRNGTFVLLSVFSREVGRGYCLKSVAGHLADQSLEKVLMQGIVSQRIPHAYIPLDLEEISRETVVKPLMESLVAAAVRGPLDFTLEALCKGMTPMWRWISEPKRDELSKVSWSLLRELKRGNYGKGIVACHSEPEKRCTLCIPEGRSREWLREQVQQRVQKFVAHVHSLPLPDEAEQLSLF